MNAQPPARTPDGHHVVIEGRRWRATDPSIPDPVLRSLRHDLASARGTVGAAMRAGDDERERAARRRVQVAKVGLGERGTPWWEQSPAQRQQRWTTALAVLRDQNA
ncbi:MAG TPA: hypothetical protein VNB94_01080 [Mycobacteriales bacterium]|nr:hypothetical protein [Mycobacteriales bacterium]